MLILDENRDRFVHQARWKGSGTYDYYSRDGYVRAVLLGGWRLRRLGEQGDAESASQSLCGENV